MGRPILCTSLGAVICLLYITKIVHPLDIGGERGLGLWYNLDDGLCAVAGEEGAWQASSYTGPGKRWRGQVLWLMWLSQSGHRQSGCNGWVLCWI